MMEMKKQSHWWWFEAHNNSPRRSPWLQSTLAELDEKTKTMLKLIEEDADSFAQRAELFYKKRPELINMVEDFYRAHRSLAERFDQVKSEPGPRPMTTLGSPFSFAKYRLEKLASMMDRSYDTYSETFDPEESAESEVEDPEQEDETQIDKEMSKTSYPDEYGESEVEDPEQEDETQGDKEMEEEEVSSEVIGLDKVKKLREEIERLEDENRVQKVQLMQKDEEKREVIRQLSLAVEMLKEENVTLRKRIARNTPKKRSPLEFNKLKGMFLGKFFGGSSKPETSVVAL